VRIEGKALKYGDDINTDLIYPAKYMVYTKPEEIAKYAFAGLDPDFPAKVKLHGLIVSGKNFGCGSSREHAPLALKHTGIRCVISESFARIFYRNAVNIGLPVLECEGIHRRVDEGDTLDIKLLEGRIENISKKQSYKAKPLPTFLVKILEHGGLIEHLNAESTTHERV